MSPHAAGQLLSDTENSNPKMTPIWHRKMKFYRLLKPFPAWAKGADCWRRCVPPPPATLISSLPPRPAPSTYFSFAPNVGEQMSLAACVRVPRLRMEHQQGPIRLESIPTLLLFNRFSRRGETGKFFLMFYKISVSWWLKVIVLWINQIDQEPTPWITSNLILCVIHRAVMLF